MSRDNERAKQRTRADTERANSRTNRSKGESRNAATERDTERAKAITERDTEQANSRTDRSGVGGMEASRAGGAHPSFEQREREAGLYLAGNDPMSGRRGDSSADAAESYEQRSGSAVQRAINPVVENVGSSLEGINFEASSIPLLGPNITLFQFVFADGSTQEVNLNVAIADYDSNVSTDWSIKLPVNGTTFRFTKGTLTFDDETEFFDDDPQTFYVVPLIRNERAVTTGGVFRETIVCVSGEPIVQLVKIA
jgi:hypothetical protein